jgi:predicted secreted protein
MRFDAEEFGTLLYQQHARCREHGSFRDAASVDLLRTLNFEGKIVNFRIRNYGFGAFAILQMHSYPFASHHRGGRENGESKKGSLD